MPRTLPCNVCGEDYTDNIDPKVDPDNGGYIICARCTMGLVAHQKKKEEEMVVEIEPDKLVGAIKDRKLFKFRETLRLSQSDLAGRLGITTRHLRRMEDSSYIPNSKALRKIEIKLKNVRSV